MKRIRLQLALVLLILGTLVPTNALCLGAFCASAHMQHAHACCRRASHTPEVEACCAPQPSQPSAIPQASPILSAAAQVLHAAPARDAAHLSLIAHARPMAFPPDAAPTPPLVLRT
jgi:hypothetical protein